MTNPDHCAFSVPENAETSGLTKREYFAAMALQGLLATPDTRGNAFNFAVSAVEHADALIETLNQPHE